jgi:hypothetical protein
VRSDNPANVLLPATPPFLTGCALLVWGWQCNFIPYALGMAVLLESARYIHWRTPITDKEFNYISDLSSVIFMLAVIYIFATRSYHGIFTILALLPFFFFLLILAQTWSVQGNIKPGALFMSMRKYNPDEPAFNNPGIDLSFPYLFVCILSSSAGNREEEMFFILVVILVAWALWILRPLHTGKYLWSSLLVIAIATGYGGQLGLLRLQQLTEATFLQWFEHFMWRSRDPGRTTTAIGSLGKLKFSDRIMVRVDTHGYKLSDPLYLREVSYNNYGYGVWTNFQHTLRLIDPLPQGRYWIINDQIAGNELITISFHMDDQKAIIPVPMGLSSISKVNAIEIEHSPYGALSMELNPGWVRYDAMFDHERIDDAPPGKEELEIPSVYRKELAGLANQLGLESQSQAQRVETVKKYFADNFVYSLTQTERYPRGKYLSKFLFETRKGHCEYFATATTLLLRAAQIPTRYVVGYAIDEYSPLEGQYIGRARHVHSWVLAYVDNRWQMIDTTPSVWAPLEAMDRSFIEPLVDFWSWISYKLSTWNTDDTKSNTSGIFYWLLVPVLLYFLWRMFIKDRVQNIRRRTKEKQLSLRLVGIDSAFFQLLPVLEALYVPRKPWETLTTWLAKIEKNIPDTELQNLLALHYRYRFDPSGLSPDEKQMLELKVKKQLAIME